MQNINMENRSHHHNYLSRRFSHLFPSSCRFDAFTDVVESSIVAQNPKNLQPIKPTSLHAQKHQKHNPKSKARVQKQSSLPNSCLFSTKEGADIEIETEDYFSFSSDSSLSSSPETRNSHPNLGFSTRRINELRINEVGPCSSSGTSTSSSISSISPLKEQKPRLWVTLAENFRHDSESFRSKTWKSKEIRQKTDEIKHLSSLSRPKNTEIHPNLEIQLCPIYMKGKIEESYALEKESNDPYKDFRESMVEMIMEKNISRAEDLEKLLLCFISLNSSVYHRVILDVFSEIFEALIGG